jgi:uncharacterized membrane protein
MHLLHPALVHFAIAFLVAGGLAESIGILARRERAERFGSVLVVLGTLALVPTVASGFLALNVVTLPAGSHDVMGAHERMGIVLLGTFLALALWKGWHQGRIPEVQRPLYAVALLGGVAMVLGAAWLGGTAVYAHGVGVRLP